MSATLLEPPPARPRASKNQAPVPSGPAGAPPGQRRGHRVIWFALAISAVVHLLVLLLIRFEAPRAPQSVPIRAVTTRPIGMEVINIAPVPELAEPATVEPERAPVRELEQPRDEPVRERAVAPEAPERRDPLPTVGERISPRLGDPRLFAEPSPSLPATVDREALARERLLAKIGAYNDSSAADAEAARKATDWTVKDGNGGRWGVSPGKIHLGGLTLPLPVNLAPPPGRREELAERNRRWGEIEGQRAREEGRATFDERVKAIRERNDAKRDSTRKSGSGGD
jgi:hypothetical protein